jgi:hypothetical protein
MMGQLVTSLSLPGRVVGVDWREFGSVDGNDAGAFC